MQVLGRIDGKTRRVTGIGFSATTFEDERILGELASALENPGVRVEVLVEDLLVVSLQFGEEYENK